MPTTNVQLLAKVKDFVLSNNLISPNDSIIISISGGPDSVFLTYFLHNISSELNLNLRALHINYHLRGDESSRDEKFTKEFCNNLGIPIDVVHFEPIGTGNIQDLARRFRINTLLRQVRKYGFNKVALGHTADDLLETFLWRLFKSTSPKAWVSLRMKSLIKNTYFIRPLMSTSKSSILSFLEKHNIPYVVDSSNLKVKYTRNKIRHVLIPTVESVIPGFKNNAVKSVTYLQEMIDYIDGCISKIFTQVSTITRDEVKIKLTSINELKSFEKKQIILMALNKLNFNYSLKPGILDKIVRIIPKQTFKGNKILFRKRGFWIIGEYAYLTITTRGPAKINELLYIPSCVDIANMSLCVRGPVPITDNPKATLTRFYCNIDDRLKILVRSPKPGDKILISPSFTKKIKDIFIDEKIPLSTRWRSFVVSTIDNEIIALYIPNKKVIVNYKFWVKDIGCVITVS